MELLRLSHITCSRGKHKVLNRLNFKVELGRIHVILGEHGAGKSTLVRTMCGLINPDAGLIYINGRRQKRFSYFEARKQCIEFVPQEGDTLKPLTVIENFTMLCGKKKIRRNRLKTELSEFLRQKGFSLPLHHRITDIGAQDIILLNILKHVYQRPRLLILDEILDKLEPHLFSKVMLLLSELKIDGTAIVIVSHNINDLYSYADTFSIVRHGQTVLTKKVSNIDRVSLIKLAYLGTGTQVRGDMSNPEFRALLRTNFYVLVNLPVIMILVDHEEKILMLSNAARKFFAIDDSNLPDLNLKQVLTNRPEYERVVNRCGKDTSSRIYNITLRYNGGKRIFDILINPIKIDHFRVGDIVILNDTTDKELLKTQLILKDRLSSIGLLSMGVAHEINNPLDIVLKCTDLLKNSSLNQTQHELVQDIEIEIDTISRIVEALMSTSGSIEKGIEIFDFNEMLRTIIKQVSRLASDLSIVLSVDLAKHSILIKANPTQIKQVLLDLIKNSFEAIEKDGMIEISTSIILSNENPIALFTIRDNGKGFDGDNSEDIFLPFFSTKSSSGKNLGLGLYCSYNIVKEHGGEIIMEENSGKGAVFHVKLPLAEFDRGGESIPISLRKLAKETGNHFISPVNN